MNVILPRSGHNDREAGLFESNNEGIISIDLLIQGNKGLFPKPEIVGFI